MIIFGRIHDNEQRHNLGPNTTPVTAESFTKWKKDRVEKREKLEFDTRKAKQEAMAKLKQGLKNTGMVFSGRDMFEFNPDWAHAGDEEGEGDDLDLEEMKRDKKAQEDQEEQNVNDQDMAINGDDDVVMQSIGGSVESLQIDE